MIEEDSLWDVMRAAHEKEYFLPHVSVPIFSVEYKYNHHKMSGMIPLLPYQDCTRPTEHYSCTYALGNCIFLPSLRQDMLLDYNLTNTIQNSGTLYHDY